MSLQFSQTWQENFYMEEKECLAKAHSLDHCLKVWDYGNNRRDLNNYELASFSIQSLCLAFLKSQPHFYGTMGQHVPYEAMVLVDQLVFYLLFGDSGFDWLIL